MRAEEAPPPTVPHEQGRVRSGARADLVAVLGVYLLLGILAGVVWWLLVHPAAYTKLQGGGEMSETQLGREFDADGWYTVIALVAGLLSGLALTWWRSRDHLLTTVLVAVGSVLAAAVSALTGRLLGPGSTEAALKVARVGADVPVPLAVAGWVPYLVWPIAAMAGSLLVLWSSTGEPQDDERAG